MKEWLAELLVVTLIVAVVSWIWLRSRGHSRLQSSRSGDRRMWRRLLTPLIFRGLDGYYKELAGERADQSGQAGLAAGDAQGWQASADAAQTLRRELRRQIPLGWFNAARWWVGTLLGIVGAIGLGAFAVKLAIEAVADPRHGMLVAIFAAVPGAALVLCLAAGIVWYVVREYQQRASAVRAVREWAAATGGAWFTNRRAVLAELDWLDAHEWGPAPFVHHTNMGSGFHFVAQGTVEGEPVQIAFKQRRYGAGIESGGDAPPDLAQTVVYIARRDPGAGV